MVKLSRRNLLLGLGALGATCALPLNKLSWARGPGAAHQIAPDHFLVYISVWGAMDVTLGLDPWLKPDPR